MGRIRTIAGPVRRNHRGHFIKKTITATLRREIVSRYGASLGNEVKVKCHYCEFIGSIHWFLGASRKNSLGWPSLSGLEYDHVKPEIRGGETTSENIVLACRKCNRSKGYKYREGLVND